MNELIKLYIDSKKNSWSVTTLKSEYARLCGVASSLNGDPEVLWGALKDHKPYTRQTIWTRVSSFWTWGLAEKRLPGPNRYEAWRKSNAKLFKNVYQKERIEVTYEDARRRIELIPDEAIRKRAKEILFSAQRFSESKESHTGHSINGKGNKARPDFRPELPGPSYDKSYVTFYRALKKVGLKPHTLRKLALTRLVEKGANAYDLMEVAGWSSVQTASSYIQPKEISRLKALLHNE